MLAYIYSNGKDFNVDINSLRGSEAVFQCWC